MLLLRYIVSMKNAAILVTISLLLLAVQARGQAASVEVQALLGNTAVLMIDGQRKMLKIGESFAGVTVVSTQSTTATLDINGTRKTLGLSQRVGTRFQERAEKLVTIARDERMQYRTNASINGHSALVLVDTGANMVAISSRQAKAMNIDYSSGIPAKVETASGITDAYGISLRSVSVGEIRVENVPAMVVDGAYPATILLGMSYLQHVKMQEHNGILSLSSSH